MPSSRQRITVIGTGCFGASIGLAIRRSKDAEHLEVVGHDREHGIARQAKKLGAFDDVHFNLDLALRGAQLVVLAVPLAALREVLQDVGRLLEPNSGAVVTDIGNTKVPAIAWAAEALPEGVHYVGGDVFLAPESNGWEPLQGLSSASEDLFQDAVYAIMPQDDDHPSAVRTVNNLALTLGAAPLYMDPVEHDAVRAMASTLPALLSTVFFHAISETPGWPEVRRAAGREFASATAGASGDAPSLRMAALLGRETVLAGLDEVLVQLRSLRDMVAERDGEGLDTRLSGAVAGRARWMLATQTRAWQMTAETVEQGGLFQRTLHAMFGEGLTKKPERSQGPF
ncbi:MAG: prephenate dehydrogenase/arogenate dehydrogenase family protein [Anaerolineae bacterium]|nr:prephenate dehydrogenase/arogenate dehydrogenase family protein [Anaerolineae bacterium]